MTQTELTPSASVIGKWKPYSAFKDSGVEWLGKIPTHWEVKRLKRMFRVINGATPRGSESAYWDGEIPWVTPEDLGSLNNRVIISTARMITEEGYQSCGTSLVPTGSLVLSTRAPIGHLAIAGISLCTNQGCRALVFRHNCDITFFFYQLLAMKRELQSWGQGSTFLELGKSKLEGVIILVPPTLEQRVIASFLDRETARINTLIAKKERLIELLQEKRAALISHAVTKGLDPKVPMKDSGVEWLGEIPVYWEVKRLKFAASFYGGGTPFKENLEYWSGDIPWVSPKDMKSEIINDSEDHITKKAIENSSTRLVQPGAVLVVVRSGILRHSIPVVINSRPIALNQDMKAIVPNPFLTPEYLSSVIRGHQDALLVEWRKEGATVESIEYELLVNTTCPIPPRSGQQAIIAYLKSETAKIDALVSRIQEGIGKLKEYSTALISAAVTGKIDVKGETASQDEEKLIKFDNQDR